MASIPIPNQTTEGYLHEIEIDEVKWGTLVGNTRTLIEMFDMALAQKMNLIDPVKEREVVLEVIRRLLASGKVIVLDDRINEGTDVWDFDPESIIDLLRKNWDLLEAFAYSMGDHNIVFFSKDAVDRVKEFYYSKPITVLKSPPIIKSGFPLTLSEVLPKNEPSQFWMLIFAFDVTSRGYKQTDEEVVKRYARRRNERTLYFSYAVLSDALEILKMPKFPAEEIAKYIKRSFSDDAARKWVLSILREYRKECLLYVEERKAQSLPVVPLPTGVELPEIPEKEIISAT